MTRHLQERRSQRLSPVP